MLCPNVKHNISWRVDGQVSPCNNIINFPVFYNLSDMYVSDAYRTLSKNNIGDVRSEYCTRCWDKELLGLTSKRQADLKLHSIYIKINENYQKIDSALGSTCNAACVICGPDSSSLWQRYIPINKIEKKTELWSICDSHLNDIVQLDFGGGEPWLNEIDKQELLFDKLIQEQLSKKIKIRYNTNGSLYPKKLLEKLKNFRQVEITLSIDDIEERFEYNRYPLKWNTVNKNIIDLLELTKNHSNIIITINYTVSVFTWLRAEQFLNWAKTVGFNTVNYNILTEPKLYSIKNIDIRNSLPCTQFDDIVGQKPMVNWKQSFIDQITKLDQERNTVWYKVFPELKGLL